MRVILVGSVFDIELWKFSIQHVNHSRYNKLKTPDIQIAVNSTVGLFNENRFKTE